MKRILSTICILGAFLNLQAQEIKKEFYDNGSVRVEYKEVNGLPDGIVKVYYETGELQRALNYSNGQQNGESIIYFPSGKKFKILNYVNGEQVDTMKIYYKSGQLQELSIIKNGMKEGTYLSYYSNGNLAIEGATKEGQIHGYCKHYLENGDLQKEGNYEYGNPVGNWTEYDEIGVTYKQYKDPNENNIPSEITIENFENGDFSLQHSNLWEIGTHQNAVVKFMATSLRAKGVFKDNMTLVVQPIDKRYPDLISFDDHANTSLKEKYDSFNVLTDLNNENESFKYRDVIYTMRRDLGYSSLPLKFWTRYFIIGKDTYQFTFCSKEENFDPLLTEITDVFQSFRKK